MSTATDSFQTGTQRKPHLTPSSTPHRATMVIYGAGATQLSCTVLRNGHEPAHVPLAPWSELVPLVDGLRDAIFGTYPPSKLDGELARFADDWGPRLLPPSELLGDCDALVVIPHASIHGLPIHVVRLSNGAHAGLHMGVSYAPSTSLYQRCCDRNPGRHSDQAHQKECVAYGADLLHGDPRYFDLAREFASYFSNRELLNTHRADAVRSVLRMREFTRETVDYPRDVLCMVCHGDTSTTNWNQYGLVVDRFAGGITELSHELAEGRFFSIPELPFRAIRTPTTASSGRIAELLSVEELRVRAFPSFRLVALLGCDTAAGTPSVADSVPSLTNSFLRAGSVSALSSKWNLQLDYVKAWLRDFLPIWLKKETPLSIAAGRSTAIQLESNPDLPLRIWAPLTVSGDWY